MNFCFSATVANLQAKVESLTTTNALMKEDMAISKNTMISLVEENNQLKHALGKCFVVFLPKTYLVVFLIDRKEILLLHTCFNALLQCIPFLHLYF